MTAKIRRATRHHRCAQCGYDITYPNATATEGRMWFNRHSCQRRERMMLKAVKAEVREAAVDRTPQPCSHKQADHQHGQRATYVLDACRCTPCAEANAAAESERTRLKAYGRYNKYVDANPIRLHLAELKTYGIGLKQVSKLSGVSNGSLTKIWYGNYAPADDGPSKGCKGNGMLLRGPARRVLRTTAERLYAIEPIPANLSPGQADHERTPLARLHLQALVALGWSQSKLATRLGMLPTNMQPVIQGARALSRRTVDDIEALYEDLCMTLPPQTNQRERIAASRARNYSREREWLPPLALADLDVEPLEDEPDCDQAAVWRVLNGDRNVKLTIADRREVVRRLHPRGLSDRQIAEQAGLSSKTVLRIRQELDLPANSASIRWADYGETRTRVTA